MSDAAEIGPGSMLAQLRGERGLSVADVAQRLKYGTRQIEALETGDFGRLPGATFVRGIIRSYAKLLDADPQPLLKAFDREHAPVELAVDLRAKRVPFPDGVKRGTSLYLGLTLLVLAVVLGVLYEWHAEVLAWLDGTPAAPAASAGGANDTAAAVLPVASVPTADTVAPQPSAVPAPMPAPAVVARRITSPANRGEARVHLVFEDESWVEIKDRDGRTLMWQLNPRGSQRVVEGRPPLSVVIGNAAAVRLSYNDHPVDLKPHVKVEVARLTLE